MTPDARPPDGEGPPATPGAFRIDREGVWRHDGQEVTHPGVVASLYANLRAEGREHYLQVGARRVPVTVDDAPFLVTRVETAGPAPPTALLSDGTREALDPGGLWLGPGSTPYWQVKGGRFTARLSVAAWLQLAPLLAEGPRTGEVVLVVSGRRIPVPRRG